MINIEKLIKIAYPSNPDAITVSDELAKYMPQYEINTTYRICHFIAQIHHESGGFKYYKENLNYSAKALNSVFKKYFPTLAVAEQYARQPEKIANLVYANRMGNGSPESGDGWKYRGRGFIQCTGKNNYTECAAYLKIDCVNDPDLLCTQDYAVLSAIWYWNTRNLNKLADSDDILGITKKINGGTIGLEDRQAQLNILKSAALKIL